MSAVPVDSWVTPALNDLEGRKKPQAFASPDQETL